MNKALLLLPFPIVAFGAGLAASETLPSPVTLIVPVLIILVLVVLNGFFVAAEFAIIGVRPSEVDKMVQEGTPRAGEI